MARHLWRTVRPLETGVTAAWLRLYYDLLRDAFLGASSIDEIARSAVRRGHETFRSDLVALAGEDHGHWNVLPYRPNDQLSPPLEVPILEDPDGPRYEAAHIVEIPDVEAYKERFPYARTIYDRRVRSIVSAAFGPGVGKRGYLSLPSFAEQHYSGDELLLVCLHALALGIAVERVDASAVR